MIYRTARLLARVSTIGVAALAFLVVPLVAAANLAFVPAIAVGAARAYNC